MQPPPPPPLPPLPPLPPPPHQQPPPPITTPRLLLIPSTAELARAATEDRSLFSQLLNATVTEQWPPEVLADVEAMFAARLTAQPHLIGWFGWYIIATSPSLIPHPHRTLAGSIGCMPPNEHGAVMFGYSILPEFEGKGLATEAALAFVPWLRAQPSVTLLRADSFERNYASCKILLRCGLTLIGTSPDDPTAADSDRKGRGTLLRFEQPVQPRPALQVPGS